MLVDVPSGVIPCGPVPGRVVPFWCLVRPLVWTLRSRGIPSTVRARPRDGQGTALGTTAGRSRAALPPGTYEW